MKGKRVQQKIKTLAKVAKALNEASIPWALGGSGALYFLGLLDGFRDVDLMVAQPYVAAAQQAIEAVEGLENTGYVEKYDLLQYCIDGLDFDVMKGFHFGEYAYTLQTQDILKGITVRDAQIPLHSLDIWREFYRLMGRTERVALIEQFTKKEI